MTGDPLPDSHSEKPTAIEAGPPVVSQGLIPSEDRHLGHSSLIKLTSNSIAIISEKGLTTQISRLPGSSTTRNHSNTSPITTYNINYSLENTFFKKNVLHYGTHSCHLTSLPSTSNTNDYCMSTANSLSS